MRSACLAVLVVCLPMLATATEAAPYGTFAFSLEVDVPRSPEQTYDLLTGDISAWWDHTMSGDPLRLEIQPRPGGHFLEVFDASGDGVVHATVTQAQRGKLLRMVGPFGLAGYAVDMVTTYTLTAADTGCRLMVTVHAAGEVHEGWPEIVEKTWRHFIVDRFVPFVRGDL